MLKIDSVLFAEEMTSDIRIVQSGLRPCRKDPTNLDKIAKILLPISKEKPNKLKQVLLKMKSSDTIIDKIKIIDNTHVPNLTDVKDTIYYDKYNLNNEDKLLLQKIELGYLKEELQYKEINNLMLLNLSEITNSNKVILCPVSDISFENYYKSVFSQMYNNCL